MASPHDRPANYDPPGMPSESEILAAMEESEQDVAAGRTVPVADVSAELNELADRIEVRRRTRQAGCIGDAR
jgi:hypothetical protein